MIVHVHTGSLCADHLAANPDDFAPFCEFSDSITSFDQYVDRVRSSSEWGGHLELRALSEGLKKRIVVYSANQPVLVLGEEGDTIRLSYHLHYYSLGEHYNQVVPKTTFDEE
jgi:OTU domain-containing protein 6